MLPIRCSFRHLAHWKKNIPTRYMSFIQNSTSLSVQDMISAYKLHEQRTEDHIKTAIKPANPQAIYANNEVSFDNIEVFGFDYDYTLATYTEEVYRLIYRHGISEMISKLKYPKGLNSMEYEQSFAIRGLHYDIKNGYLFKLDAYHSIQTNTIFKGWQSVNINEIYDKYEGTHISWMLLAPQAQTNAPVRIKHFIDLFAPPVCVLLANVIEFFMRNKLEFHEENVFQDVAKVIEKLHASGDLHKMIGDDLPRYLSKDENGGNKPLLKRLASAGKKLFLITNSPFEFVNKGMLHIIGPDWRDLFDVIVCNAKKPLFFTDDAKLFRELNPQNNSLSWNHVSQLRKGQVFEGGNVTTLMRLMGWRGQNVLYFGDHVFSDLADATLRHGWKTGAIVPEVEREIELMNSMDYRRTLLKLMLLQTLIVETEARYESSTSNAECRAILDSWIHEREELKADNKAVLNPRFGSVFRTHHNPTYFMQRLQRYADIYMGSLSCLDNYSLTHTFHPRRRPLPHEPSWQNISISLSHLPPVN